MHSPLLTTIFSVFGAHTSLHYPPSPTTQRKAIRWAEFIKHPKEFNMRSGDIFLDFDGVADHCSSDYGEAEEEDGRVHRVYLDTDGEWVEVTEQDWDSADWDDDAMDWSEFQSQPEPEPQPQPTVAAVAAAVPAVAPVLEITPAPQLKRKRTEDEKPKGKRQWINRRNTNDEDGDGYETGLQVDMRMSLAWDEEEELGLSGLRVSRYVWRPEEMRTEVDVWRTRLGDDE